MFFPNTIQLAEIERQEALRKASRNRALTILRRAEARPTALRRLSGQVGQHLVALGLWLQRHSSGWEASPEPMYNKTRPSAGYTCN
ncbi:MAG: hypothetical protein DIU68_019335 [Chloroflexota bacterium]|nr:MAG: hypothetical protein DIU68_17605 [Chloroflexota bacterium]